LSELCDGEKIFTDHRTTGLRQLSFLLISCIVVTCLLLAQVNLLLPVQGAVNDTRDLPKTVSNGSCIGKKTELIVHYGVTNHTYL